MCDRLVVRERCALIRLQRGAFDVLNQAPSVLRVGQDADGEVPLRDDLEQQDVTPSVPPCAATADRSDGAQVPRDPDVVVSGLLVQLRRAHQLQRRAGQHATAVRAEPSPR